MEGHYKQARTREFVRAFPATWWLRRPTYLRFIVRELSSGFIAAYAVFLLILMSRAKQDLAAFSSIVDALKSPVSIGLHLAVLYFALFNTITTFNLAPKVVVLYRGEDRVPDWVISGIHYAAWMVVSLLLLVIAFKI